MHRKVVNISSIAGLGGNAGQANYSAAKAGIVGLTKALAKEWGRYKVNVNCVAFGLIKTRLTEATAADGAAIDVEGRKIQVGVNPEPREGDRTDGAAGPRRHARAKPPARCTCCARPNPTTSAAQTVVCGGGLMI